MTARQPSAPLTERYRLAKRLDTALTDAMRAAYAAERVAIGPLGYDDRIYRRKAKATSPVRVWSAEAERLLTLRESHRLTGIPRVPRSAGDRRVGRARARFPAGRRGRSYNSVTESGRPIRICDADAPYGMPNYVSRVTYATSY